MNKSEEFYIHKLWITIEIVNCFSHFEIEFSAHNWILSVSNICEEIGNLLVSKTIWWSLIIIPYPISLIAIHCNDDNGNVSNNI